MKKIVFFPAIVIVSMFLLMITGCNYITCDGEVESEIRDIKGFDKIYLAISAKVILKQDSLFKVRIEAQPEILDILLTEVHGNILKIRYDKCCISRCKEVLIYLSMPELEKINVSGSGEVICQQTFNVDDLDIRISGSGDVLMDVVAREIKSTINGSGKIELRGITREHDIDITGSGKLYAYDLRSDNTSIDISGSGNCKVLALQLLDVYITGSGDVYYKGSPEVESTINGSGNVQKID